MTKVAVSLDLFVKGKEHTDQGVMNIGKQCHKCQQVDFLPFICEYCKDTFCSSHRTPLEHQCPKLPKEKIYMKTESHGPTAASLFPDRALDKALVEKKLKDSSPSASNILGHNNGKGNVMAKFTKFLNLQKHGATKKGLISSLASRGTSSKTADILLLRKQAKGNIKVAPRDRVYVFCLYINPEVASSESEDRLFKDLDVKKERVGLWVSKAWPIGRALDSIADCLSIKNVNNVSKDTSEKLYIFKDQDGKPTMILNNARVTDVLSDGDTIYLVRGVL